MDVNQMVGTIDRPINFEWTGLGEKMSVILMVRNNARFESGNVLMQKM